MKEKKYRNYCNLPTQEVTIILLLAVSGMRIDVLPFLKKKNLILIDKYQLYKIEVYEGEPEE